MAHRTTSARPSGTLDPSMPAVDGFRAVLIGLTVDIDANWEGALDRVDPEQLHDLRVALRRTRTLLGQGKRVLPPDVVATARPVFARVAALTGPARDLDVLVEQWLGHTASFDADTMAALVPAKAALDARGTAAHDLLDAGLRSADTAYEMAWWRATLAGVAAMRPAGETAGSPLGRVVRRRINKVHHDLIRLGRSIDATSPAAQVHELRKTAKKLRYLIECFEPLLHTRSARRFVTRLKALQDTLGEHQDAVVHADVYRSVAVDLSARPDSTAAVLALGRVIERLEQRRLAARVELVERFDDFDARSVRSELARMLDRSMS
jgi:CHAD domain-containing protein